MNKYIMPYENIETLLITTHKALNINAVPNIIKKLSDKDLIRIFESTFLNLPFETYFMQTVKDSIFRARPILLNCYRGFNNMTKKDVISNLPVKIREELIQRNRDLKPMGVFLPFYQAKVMSPRFFNNEINFCLYGDYQNNEEEGICIEKIELLK